MIKFAPIPINNGTVWVEVEEIGDEEFTTSTTGGLQFTNGSPGEQVLEKFEDVLGALKEHAGKIKTQLGQLAPQEIEVEFAIKALLEAEGKVVFAQGKVGAEATYTVKMKWDSRNSG